MDSDKMGSYHKRPEYLLYLNRLKTFKNWPKQIRQNKYSLASSGLFYTNENDTCECFSCGVRLSQWGPYDDPLTEYKKWYAGCLFLKITGYGENETDDKQNSFELPLFLEQLCKSDTYS